MQRTLIAITFALALTSALASYNATGYSKAPVQVIADNETSFTNLTGRLGLASIHIGELSVYSANYIENTTVPTASSWKIFLKKVDAKALSAGASSNYSFNGTMNVHYLDNFVYFFATEKVDEVTQLKAFQYQLTENATLVQVTISNHTNNSFIPVYLASNVIGKIITVFYTAPNKTVNVTTYTIGANFVLNRFNLTTNYTSGLQVTWGESLGTNNLLAMWFEDEILKDTLFDTNKGTSSPATVTGYNKSFSCAPFATDKTLYGEICSYTETTNTNTTLYVKKNTTGLIPFKTYPAANFTALTPYPYGPYVILDFQDKKASNTSDTFFYEIWNVDTLVTFKNATQYLQIDSGSKYTKFRVVSGGLYTLLYNQYAADQANVTGISVGLLLGGSYLTSVLGFLLTIIAGLLLF